MRKSTILRGVIASLALSLAMPGHAKDAEPAFSLKTPIEQIVANPAGRALIEAEMPGFLTHPMYEQLKVKSIDELNILFQNGAPPERLAVIDKALRAIPADDATRRSRAVSGTALPGTGQAAEAGSSAI